MNTRLVPWSPLLAVAALAASGTSTAFAQRQGGAPAMMAPPRIVVAPPRFESPRAPVVGTRPPVIGTPGGDRPGGNRPPGTGKPPKDEGDSRPPRRRPPVVVIGPLVPVDPPTRTRCEGGRLVAARCVCPSGRTLDTVGPRQFVCNRDVVVKPPAKTIDPGRPVGRPTLPPSGPPAQAALPGRPIPLVPPAIAATLGGEAHAQEIVIIMAPNSTVATENQLARRHRLEIVERISFDLLGERLIRCRWPSSRSVPAVISAVRADTSAREVQANFVYRPSQSPPATAIGSLQYAHAKLDLADTQGLSTGRGARVAIIDSAVDPRHPDFGGATIEAFDALGGPLDQGTHGTAIAGIIAARGTLRGIAPAATLMSVRAFPSDATTKTPMTTTFVLLKSLEWSIANRARVVNLSLAGPRDPLLERALAAAAARGIILVAAAGNNGAAAPPAYPAAYADVIAVTAIDSRDELYSRANRGPYIAVAAPGVDVLAPARGSGHDLQTGTSFAAAHISGVLALMIERNPALTVEEARRALVETAIDLGTPGKDDAFGAGRASAGATLRWMAK
jgi:subtilisin family serine protease